MEPAELMPLVRTHATQTLDEQVNSHIIPLLRSRPVSSERSPAELHSTADDLKSILERVGLENVQILREGESYPAVYGEYHSPLIGAPTLLVQGHYDGQPSDLKRWTVTHPHEPVIVTVNGERRLYGRGASDDLGQVFTHVVALDFYRKHKLPLPINLKFLFEGGGEVGSKDMDTLVEKHKDLLRADVVMITDSAPGRMDHPVITTSGRGLVGFNVTLKTGTNNPHSGDNIAFNAVATLAALLTSMKDYVTQRVLIPHFYDDVQDLSPREREQINAMQFDTDLFRMNYGLQQLVGEQGFTFNETMWHRPSYEIHEIRGGMASNIIPTEVSTYVTMRLVPRQKPEKIGKLFVEELYHRAEIFGLQTSQLIVTSRSSSFPFNTSTDHPSFRKAEQAMAAAFGTSVDYMGCGGTEPIVLVHQQILKAPVIFNAYNSPSDHYHGDNESFSLDLGFIPGVVANVLFYELLAQH